MTGNVPFLMKDIVLLTVSLYLLRPADQSRPLFNEMADRPSAATDFYNRLGQ